MDELFNILSSSARIDKSKRRKNKRTRRQDEDKDDEDGSEDRKQSAETLDTGDEDVVRSRDRTGKRDTSEEKLCQVHQEQVAAFRRSMSIRVANKKDPDLQDPISSFHEMSVPNWWKPDENSYSGVRRALLGNIEAGRWKEPTPIQMQAIPTLMARRDFIGCAPTGQGKTGAFVLPALMISSSPSNLFYGISSKNVSKKKKRKKSVGGSGGGEIRSLILAPSHELASQIFREVQRLGMGKPGGLSALLLSKSNSAQVVAGSIGGKNGLDVLVSTPLRVVDAIEKGLRLDTVRFVCLDEADRLLDATDGHSSQGPKGKSTEVQASAAGGASGTSGTSQSRTFLSQMDTILSDIPPTATRCLFSATITPFLRLLSESVLRNPVDITIASNNNQGGANPDIEQELMFVGREEGKLLAIRQLVQRGQLQPPAIIFMQSQERAQALFGELLYDGIHVDVIHAGRSKSARENAVAKFRRGETWVLICTDGPVGRGVDFPSLKMVINYDLPSSGVTYVHRIGRTGRAGRKGKAITFFTEADFENLRTIANVMKQSGCKVEDWMLNLSRGRKRKGVPRRQRVSTTPSYDIAKARKKKQMIQESKKKKSKSTDSDAEK